MIIPVHRDDNAQESTDHRHVVFRISPGALSVPDDASGSRVAEASHPRRAWTRTKMVTTANACAPCPHPRPPRRSVSGHPDRAKARIGARVLLNPCAVVPHQGGSAGADRDPSRVVEPRHSEQICVGAGGATGPAPAVEVRRGARQTDHHVVVEPPGRTHRTETPRCARCRDARRSPLASPRAGTSSPRRAGARRPAAPRCLRR